MNYLSENKADLFPELYRVWKENGFRMKGNWEEIFGRGTLKPDRKDWQFYSYYTEELFSAWNYARYIEKIASSGKKEYPLPMYVNAWLKQPTTAWPGRYPSGGPLPQVIDIWRAGAPSIDFIAPDIYFDEFDRICKEYTRSGNPLFIPETFGGGIGAARALYVFGEYDAGCFAPFGIDNERYIANDPLDECYATLKHLSPLILRHQGKGSMRGILLNAETPERELEFGGYRIKAVLSNGNGESTEGGILINTGEDEFFAAGKGIDIFFSLEGSPFRPGINSVDEGIFKDGIWTLLRRLNGDETHASTWSGTVIRLPRDTYGIQKISIYKYR